MESAMSVIPNPTWISVAGLRMKSAPKANAMMAVIRLMIFIVVIWLDRLIVPRSLWSLR